MPVTIPLFSMRPGGASGIRRSFGSGAARGIRQPHEDVTGCTTGWKTALNALALFFGDRITLN
jgi:hypothetical protein